MVQSVIELLLRLQVIDDRQHDSALSRARSSSGGHVIQSIAELGYATEGTVARALSIELGLPRIDLTLTPPEPEALALLDVKTCRDRFVLPVALRENGQLLWLAMGDPTDGDSISIVRRKTGIRVRPVVAGPTEIARAATRLYATAETSSEQTALPDIELNEETDEESFEVVNVMDESASPLSRIAAQLGVEVPPAIARRSRPADAPAGVEIELDGEELLPLPQHSRGLAHNDLAPEDVLSLEAVRSSMEKGAQVIRILAELCVEKGVFTREEMVRPARIKP